MMITLFFVFFTQQATLPHTNVISELNPQVSLQNN